MSEVEICQGKPLCKDFSDLSYCQQKDGINCTQNWGYESCWQVNGSLHQNYACKKVLSDRFGYFGCINRKDKLDNGLFTNPISPMTASKVKGINYNEQLDFDNRRILCGKNNVTYPDFKKLKRQDPYLECDLKNGKKVYLHQLWSDLILDYSFNYSNKMDLF